jgi:hypothetical protein
VGFGIWGLSLAACGKKGPPLTPFVMVPAAPTIEAARRTGDDVIVQVMVPAANLDGSKPAAIARVDVFGATALTPPPRARFLEIATLVASIPVAPAGEPGDPVVTTPDVAKGALQGQPAVVRDTLTDKEMQPRELPVLAVNTAPAPPAAAAAATPVVPPVNVLRRFYMAIAYSPRNRSSPPSTVTEVPITVLPPAPADLQLAQTELGVTLEWEPSSGLVGWLFDRALPQEEDPVAIAVRSATAKPPPPPTDWLPGPTLYNVYRDVSPNSLVLPAAAAAPAWRVVVPTPVNPAPLAALRFDDPVVADDRERCYVVRAVRGTVEGPPSPRRCVRVVDLFPPATPTNLQTITVDGGINLIWEPNVDADLGGYIVLRSEDGGATLLPLTPSPVTENRYSDRTVRPGVQYMYEVRAVDTRVPVPNASGPVRVIETAR